MVEDASTIGVIFNQGMFRLLTLFGVLLLPLTDINGQVTAEVAASQSAIDFAIRVHTKALGGQSSLYNGTEYTEYRPIDNEHPYLIDDWTDGDVNFDGEIFNQVPLLYDLSIDRLITEHMYSKNRILLTAEKVRGFTLEGRKFVYLRGASLPAGYYEVKYDGKTKVYVRWQKSMQERYTVSQLVRVFEEKQSYFIFKDNQYFPVKSKKSALAVFGDRKSEIKKHLSKSGVHYNDDRATGIAAMAHHFDSIAN